MSIPIDCHGAELARPPLTSALPASVTFAEGRDLQKTVAFMAVDDQDMIDDDREAVKLGFGTNHARRPDNPRHHRARSTLNIGDNDNPNVTVHVRPERLRWRSRAGTQLPADTVKRERGPGAHYHHPRSHYRPRPNGPHCSAECRLHRATAQCYLQLRNDTWSTPQTVHHRRRHSGPDRRQQRERQAGVREHAGPPGVSAGTPDMDLPVNHGPTTTTAGLSVQP